MHSGAARIVVFTSVAAVVMFCAVQDRVMVAGVRDYVKLQRAAMAGQGPPTTIDTVMSPAGERSLRQALLSSGAVAGVGLVAAVVAARRGRRE